MNYINKEVYLPLLQNFCKETSSLYDCGYEYGPFIPYTMSRYNEAPLKIFYVGRDTAGWISYNELQDCLKKGSLETYLDLNAQAVTIEETLSGWGNGAGAFWPFIEKLHLMLRTGKYVEDISNITPQQRDIVEEIGFGDLFSIETPQTGWSKSWFETDNNWQLYQQLRQAGSKLDRLESLIHAYHPDLIIVTTWMDKDDELLKKDYEWQKDFYEDGYLAVYKSKTHNPPIMWTLHPRSFSFKQTNQEEMVRYIYDNYQKLKKI